MLLLEVVMKVSLTVWGQRWGTLRSLSTFPSPVAPTPKRNPRMLVTRLCSNTIRYKKRLVNPSALSIPYSRDFSTVAV